MVLAGPWTLGSALPGSCSASPTPGKANPTFLGFHHSGTPYISTPEEAVVEYGNTEEKKVPQESTGERKVNAYSLPTFLSTTVTSYGLSGTTIVGAWAICL